MGLSEESILLAISALLHDIGKFYQRTGERGEHSRLSGRFVSENLSSGVLKENLAFLQCLVEHHHEESFAELSDPRILYLARIVNEADNLSAMERAKEEEETGSSIYTQPLRSIFSKDKYAYNLRPLSIDYGALIPIPEERAECGPRLYEYCWKSFLRELKLLESAGDKEAFLETLYSILRKYTFLMPSAVYKAVPNIPLFEHLRTTCAIALCLYLYHRAYGGLIEDREAEKFLLISGDLSGIQSFIYTVSSKAAAKGLRGRSFYISILCEAIASYLARELGLPQACILYSAGGHFSILAPNTKEVIEGLKRAKATINGFLLKKFRGDLYVAIASISFRGRDFEDFSLVLERAGKEVTIEKLRRFSEEMERAYGVLFGPLEGERLRACRVCQHQVRDEELSSEGLCPPCEAFAAIAKPLGRARYLLEVFLDKASDAKSVIAGTEGFLDFVEDLGLGYFLLGNAKELRVVLGALKDYLIYVRLYKLNDMGFLGDDPDLMEALKAFQGSLSLGFKSFCNITPWNESGDIKGFDDLAKESEGARFLGVLKMDGDDMGKAFESLTEEKVLVEGKEVRRRTLARFCTLSSFISLFFDGLINRICQSKEYMDDDGSLRLYAIYSGGDDLLIVGSWDALIRLAQKIRQKFLEFTLGFPTITASLALCKPKIPIYRFADEVGRRLEDAKKLKNAIAILDAEPISFERFEPLMNLKNDMVNAIRNKEIPRSLLFQLFRIYTMYRREGEEGSYGAYRWQFKYLIGRYKSLYPRQQSFFEKLDGSVKEGLLPFMGIPLRVAEIQTRDFGKREVR